MERLFVGPERIDDTAVRIFTCDEHVATPVAERVLPDGAIHLIFTLGDVQGGERNAHLRCLAVGASTRATRIVLAGTVDQVCVRLGIGTAAAVLGVPAGELTDRGVDLGAVWGRAAADTLDALATKQRAPAAGATSPPRTTILARVLRARLRAVAPPPPLVGEAVRRIARAAGRVQLRALAAELGIGERRLQQLFYAHVGLAPRAMARLARVRAVLEHCQRARVRSWSALALAYGFYDQAHLGNELKGFTGLTPGQLGRGGDFAFFQDPNAEAEVALRHVDPA